MNDVLIFAAVRKIVRRHSGNPLEGLVQLDVDELNTALKEAQAPVGGTSGAATATTATDGHSGGATGLSDPDSFFKTVREQFGGLEQEQVDGLNALLPAMAGWPSAFAAYGLATAWHETAHTMQPVPEAYWLKADARRAYLRRMYDIEGERPAKARELGNTVPGDGIAFAGRGYVQLTGRTNYVKAAEATGEHLVGNPDLAMRPAVAAKILAWGMDKGAFTGKSLAHYLPRHGAADRASFVQARRIINGQDKATEIAEVALKFQRALQEGGWA